MFHKTSILHPNRKHIIRQTRYSQTEKGADAQIHKQPLGFHHHRKQGKHR